MTRCTVRPKHQGPPQDMNNEKPQTRAVEVAWGATIALIENEDNGNQGFFPWRSLSSTVDNNIKNEARENKNWMSDNEEDIRLQWAHR